MPEKPSRETIANPGPLAVWTSAVSAGLGLRKNGATQAEIMRLAKTLRRLNGAALQAMTDHPAKMADPAWGKTFIKTLDDLSNG